MHKLVFSTSFKRQLRKIVKQDSLMRIAVGKTFKKMKRDLNYPALRLHKLSGENNWSISVNKSVRIIFQLQKNKIYCTEIGTHDEVY